MDIKSKIKPGARVVLSIGLSGNEIRHIRIVANSVESRDEAMAQVRRILPALELLERLLSEPPKDEATPEKWKMTEKQSS